ncbi:MAG TPA: hypothetical protein VHA35_22060 [Dongiaceae bacterium]|jgi:hypothetical protein|nr:hypothetical protein [Dongiaceae bacterium]
MSRTDMPRTREIDREGHEHVPMQEARAGETTGRIRVILVVSLILAIVAMGLVVFAFVHPAAQS